MRKATGRTGRSAKRAKAAPSRPFRVADHLKTEAERAAYLEALLEDGDARIITLGLRELAESAGGMAILAERTGLSRETLYRTLSANGNPRLDTLSALLHAMGLRLSVKPAGEVAAR
ncbi:MAG: addiction module antidote protein [Burkholderiales bacterium]